MQTPSSHCVPDIGEWLDEGRVEIWVCGWQCEWMDGRIRDILKLLVIY